MVSLFSSIECCALRRFIYVVVVVLLLLLLLSLTQAGLFKRNCVSRSRIGKVSQHLCSESELYFNHRLGQVIITYFSCLSSRIAIPKCDRSGEYWGSIFLHLVSTPVDLGLARTVESSWELSWCLRGALWEPSYRASGCCRERREASGSSRALFQPPPIWLPKESNRVSYFAACV